jgi:hypothetical protein
MRRRNNLRRADKRPTGPYLAYLNRLIEKRHAQGKPPAPDVADDEYWNTWRKNNKIEQPKKAA